jgi:hypothetical protein
MYDHHELNPFCLAVTGHSDDSALFTRLSNRLPGMQLKVISGYRASDDINLAIEKSENEIGAGSWSSLKTRKAGRIAGQIIT